MQPPPIKRNLIIYLNYHPTMHQPKSVFFRESFPTDGEFNECLKSQTFPFTIRKWKKIPLDTIFYNLGVETRGAGYNPYIAHLQSENGEIFMAWIRPRIYNRLKMFDMTEKSVYIKSHGLKPCKNALQKQYSDFSVIANEQ